MSVIRVSVDSGRMRDNLPNPIRVEVDGMLHYADVVKVQGGLFINSPTARPYGARVWFETEQDVILCIAPEGGAEMEEAA